MLLRLKNDAFHAQQCYELSWMLAYFIFDLTGEKMHEPDDIMDANGHGFWKKNVYGEPFYYTTIKTQKNILDRFLIDRPIRAGIIFEGITEQIVIEEILRAIRVDKERDGFFLYNAEGQSNIVKNLDALYDFTKSQDIENFLILDNDNHARKLEDQLKMKIKDENIYKWEKDFEFDNFGIDTVVYEINKILTGKEYSFQLSKEEIEDEMLKDDKVLMLTIKKILKNQNIHFDDVISS